MIVYKDTHKFTAHQLERLFLSVNWESGKYPEKLVKAMRGYHTVYSAWENDELVGSSDRPEVSGYGYRC